MNILVLSWRDPKHPLAGGAEQVMHEHMKGWTAAGHSVTLFASRFPNSSETGEIDGIKIIRKGYQYLGVQLAGFVYYLKNRSKYDFLVDQFHGLPFFTPLYSRKPKVAVIQEVAREVWLTNELPKPLNWIVGIIGYLGEPFIFLFYRNTQFITGSASAKDDLVKVFIPKKNIHIVHHGVITKKPKVAPKKEKIKTIMFLGALTKDKGVEDAIKVFSLLNKSGNYQFWIVGKGEESYANYLKEICDKQKIKVKFWGFVSQEEKFRLYGCAHVLINPSILEGWGLVNIEANSMETPVVAYKSRGLVDSVKDNQSGILVDKNPEALAETVTSLLADKKQYKKLSEGAKKWSQQFSWEKSRQISLNLIEKIYAQKSS